MLRYPKVSDLDTTHLRTADRAREVSVYLNPDPDDGGEPRLYVAVGDGTPMLAWHGIHAHVATIPPGCDGGSVLAALEECEKEIVARARAYRGSRWNGSNLVGSWDDDERGALESAIEDAMRPQHDGGCLVVAWDAGEWLAAASPSWDELLADIGEPEDTDRDEDELVRMIVAHLETVATDDGVLLSHTEDAVRDILERWHDERDDDDDDDDDE